MNRRETLAALLALVPLTARAQKNIVVEKDSRTHESEGNTVGKQGTSWALLVGVNKYRHPFKPLAFCCNDAAALSEALISAGFPSDNVQLLTDADATASNVEEALDRLFGKRDEHGSTIQAGVVSEEDTVVIGFSGHGVCISGTSYLCTHGMDLRRPNSTMVTVESIRKRFQTSPAHGKVLMVDACRNDPYARESLKTTSRAVVVDDSRDQLAKDLQLVAETEQDGTKQGGPTRPSGRLVLSSCAVGEKSYEDPKLEHGVFTHFVLRGLAEADGKSMAPNGEIGILELAQYVQQFTKTYVAQRFGRFQTPELKGIDPGLSLGRNISFNELTPSERAFVEEMKQINESYRRSP